MTADPIVVEGHDELCAKAMAAFAPLEVQVRKYEHDGRVGIALRYHDELVFLVLGEDDRWYPTHGQTFEPCKGQPVHDAGSFYAHMAEFYAAV